MCIFIFLAYIISVFFIPQLASATADGPDYFKNKNNYSVYLYENANAQSHILAEIPAHRDYLKNMGCTGMLRLDEWEKMSDDEKQQFRENIWCKVPYITIEGWVKNTDLAEGSSIADLPMFLCDTPNLNEIEALICHDDELKVLDYEITIVYNQAHIVAQKSGNVQELENSQQNWIKARNDCNKEADKKTCTQTQYLKRIAYLQTYWALINADIKATYLCDGASPFALTAYYYIYSSIPAVKIEYNDKVDVLLESITASGAKYEDTNGKLFWAKGNKALFKLNNNAAELQCTTNQ
ncbi:MAG: MliC family protein [Alphaproteobacteria bacterium]